MASKQNAPGVCVKHLAVGDIGPVSQLSKNFIGLLECRALADRRVPSRDLGKVRKVKLAAAIMSIEPRHARHVSDRIRPDQEFLVRQHTVEDTE